jgi:hypothetical protein
MLLDKLLDRAIDGDESQRFMEGVSAIIKSSMQMRDAILKNYIANTFEMYLLGVGFVIEPTVLGTLSLMFFDEKITSDRKEGIIKLLKMREILKAQHSNFFPVHMHYPMVYQTCFNKAKQRKDAIVEYEKVLDQVLSVSINSDEYRMLYIDARFDPLTKSFITTNKLAWHLIYKFLMNLNNLYKAEKLTDKFKIIETALLDRGLIQK